MFRSSTLYGSKNMDTWTPYQRKGTKLWSEERIVDKMNWRSFLQDNTLLKVLFHSPTFTLNLSFVVRH